MSDFSEMLTDLVVAAKENGRLKERHNILSIMQDLALENKIGKYVYISDVLAYIKFEDEVQQEKRTKE